MTSHSQLADHLAQTHLGPPRLRNRSTSSGAIPTATAIVEHLSRQDRRFLPSSRRSSPPGQPGLIVASPQIDRDNFPIPATLATTASELHPRTGMEETLYTTGSEELELVEEDRKAVSGCDLPLKMAVLVHYSKKRLDSAPGETVFRDRAALYVARYLRLDEILVVSTFFFCVSRFSMTLSQSRIASRQFPIDMASRLRHERSIPDLAPSRRSIERSSSRISSIARLLPT